MTKKKHNQKKKASTPIKVDPNVQDGIISEGKRINISTGDIHHVKRGMVTIGEQIEINNPPQIRDEIASEFMLQFNRIYTLIQESENISKIDKADLKADVEDIHKVVTDQEKDVDEAFLLRRLRNIQRMAPDILEVILSTLTNPGAGVVMAARKVAQKMKEETEKSD